MKGIEVGSIMLEEPVVERDMDSGQPNVKWEGNFFENHEPSSDQAVNHISHIWIKDEPSMKEEPLDERDMKVNEACSLYRFYIKEEESVAKLEHALTRNESLESLPVDHEEDSDSATPPPSQQLHSPPSQPNNEVLVRDNDTEGTLSQPKRKRNFMSLSEQTECELANWYQNHELLYNKKLKAFRDKEKKNQLYKEKANELGITVNQLHTWFEGMRTRFARQCDKQYGSGAPALSKREEWIQTAFAFLRPHIVRCPGRKSKKHTLQTPVGMQQEGAASVEEEAVDDPGEGNFGRTEPTPQLMSSASTLKRRHKEDAEMDLLEKISATQQECLDMNARFMSLLQPRSTHTLAVKQFHSFLATMAEKMDVRTFGQYSKDAMELLHHYLQHPVPPPPTSVPNDKYGPPNGHQWQGPSSRPFVQAHPPPQPS